MDSPATFAILCEGLTIGHTAFERRGLPRGVLQGAFLPTTDYSLVKRLFRADALAGACADDPGSETLLRAYYAARDRLDISVVDREGRLLPTEYVHVHEPVASGNAEIVARLAVAVPSKSKGRRWYGSRPEA